MVPQRMVGQRVFRPWTALSLLVGNIARILPLSVTSVEQDEWCHSVDDRRHGRRASGYPLYWGQVHLILKGIDTTFFFWRERERERKRESDSWSLSHLGYLYPGTTPVIIKLGHNRSCPWV